MATVHEQLTSQIDGITDTFTTINDISEGVIVDYNGQVVNKNDITILGANSFRLSFVPNTVPVPTDTLSIFITPDRFDISGQVDGITNIFSSSPSDTSEGSFVAILNGQVFSDDTQTINSTTFSLSSIPQIGDKLSYIRIIQIKECDPDYVLPITAIIKDSGSVTGKILNDIGIFGIVDEKIDIRAQVESAHKITANVKDRPGIIAVLENGNE